MEQIRHSPERGDGARSRQDGAKRTPRRWGLAGAAVGILMWAIALPFLGDPTTSNLITPVDGKGPPILVARSSFGLLTGSEMAIQPQVSDSDERSVVRTQTRMVNQVLRAMSAEGVERALGIEMPAKATEETPKAEREPVDASVETADAPQEPVFNDPGTLPPGGAPAASLSEVMNPTDKPVLSEVRPTVMVGDDRLCRQLRMAVVATGVDTPFQHVITASTVVYTPDPLNPGFPATFTYTINLEELDPDVTGSVDEVWDQLPPGLRFVDGSGLLDGVFIANEPVDYDSSYDVDTVHWKPSPAITFSAYGEVKELTFQATGTPTADTRYCNEVALKPNDERAGKSAIVTVGTPAYGGCPGAGVRMTTTSNPTIAIPNVLTTFTYTVSFINDDFGQHEINEVKVLLATGFTYVTNSAASFGSNMTTDEPALSVDADGRQELKWDNFPVKPVPIAQDETLTQEFQATATLADSGTSYVEVFAILSTSIICDYGSCSPSLPGQTATNYSWQSGDVIVPAYDVKSDVPRSSGWGNAIPGGLSVSLESWHVENK